MKNYLNIFLTCLLIGLTISTIVSFKNNKQSEEKIKEITGPQSDPTVLKTLFFDSYLSMIIPSDGKILNPELILRDTALRSIKLKSLADSKNVLVFRFSYRDCDECVNTILKSLEKTFKANMSSRVIVVTDMYTEKDFLLKSRFYKSSFRIYATDNIGFGLPLENKNLPFVFVMSSGRVIKPFIPFKELPEEIDIYNESIKEFLNETDNFNKKK